MNNTALSDFSDTYRLAKDGAQAQVAAWRESLAALTEEAFVEGVARVVLQGGLCSTAFNNRWPILSAYLHLPATASVALGAFSGEAAENTRVVLQRRSKFAALLDVYRAVVVGGWSALRGQLLDRGPLTFSGCIPFESACAICSAAGYPLRSGQAIMRCLCVGDISRRFRSMVELCAWIESETGDCAAVSLWVLASEGAAGRWRSFEYGTRSQSKLSCSLNGSRPASVSPRHPAVGAESPAQGVSHVATVKVDRVQLSHVCLVRRYRA